MSYEVETDLKLKTATEADDSLGSLPDVNIKVVGVGGGGCNSINRMLSDDIVLEGVEFISINTDKSSLSRNKASKKLCIGLNTTKGWGAGTNPNVGQKAAEESEDDIRAVLEGADLLFITAGMGGGTGTGAAPVIASIAKDLGILTVAIVTKPFEFEGAHRMRNAEIGIENLSRFVDAYIIVPNQKLVEKFPPKTGMRESFKIADEVLRQGVIGLAETIVRSIELNVDYADFRNILKDAGLAHMGVGRARGEDRVVNSIRQAVATPLVETTINGATGLIMCIKCGEGLSLTEVSNYAMYIKTLVDERCNIKYGIDINPNYGDEVEVLIIASGFPQEKMEEKIPMNNDLDVSMPKAPGKELPLYLKNHLKNFK